MGGKEIEGVLTCRHVVLTFAVLERQVGGMTKSSEEKMGRKWKEDKEGRRRKRKSKGESERDNRGRNECWG